MYGSSLRWTLLSAVLLASACSGSSEPSPTPTISVSVAPTSLNVVAGVTAPVTITITRAGGYAGSVSLALEGAPTGVTGTFDPATVPGGSSTSTLTLTVGGSTAAGSYGLTIRATGSGVSATTTLALMVIEPLAFSLSVTPASLNVQQGATAQATVNIARTGGFSGTVNLALEGAPVGLTGAFSPAAVVGTSSILTLTALATVTTGTYNLTIRGTAAGQTDRTTTLSVTVLPDAGGSFTLSLTPAALSITQGQNAQSTVNITRTGGFTGSVTLALEGSPAGVAGVFNPNPAAGNSSLLTVSVGPATVPGNYNLTVRGSTPSPSADHAGEAAPQLATDQTVSLSLTVTVAGSYTLSATAAAAVQGGSGSSTITVTRVGGFTGSVSLALEGAPAGVTGAFLPNPATGTTSTLNLSVAGTVAPNVYNLTVRGTTAGLADQTVSLQLTVTLAEGFTLSANPGILTIAPGGNASSTITVSRTGGFVAPVTLTYTTSAPAGVTITFTPSLVVGTTSTLGVSVGNGVATGSYFITVRGNAAGQAEQTTVVTLSVQSGGAGGVSWTFCEQSGIPAWVAYQNGSAGTWTQAVAVGATYSFNFTETKGGIAWVTLDGAQADLSLVYGSVAELQNNAPECLGNGTTKTVNATMVNLQAGQTSLVTLGGGIASVTPATQANFAITGVADGVTDLVATNLTQSFIPPFFNTTLNGLLIRRSLNPADGSTIPGTLDWNGTGVITPVQHTVTVTNGSGLLQSFMAYQTANGTGALLGSLANNVSPYPFYGVPASAQQPGDLHILTVSTILSNIYAYQAVVRIFATAADQTVAFGPAPPAGDFTTAATVPYLRPRIVFTNVADYNRLILMDWTNTGGNQSSANVLIWEGYGLGLNVDYTLPDFSAVTGWNNAWGLQSGVGSVEAGFNVTGWTAGGGIGQPPEADGTTAISAGRRVDNISP
jgi:uncharacterized membrane protein